MSAGDDAWTRLAPWRGRDEPGAASGSGDVDETALLQSRVGVFGRVGAVLSVGYLVVVSALSRRLAIAPSLLVLGVALTLGGLWVFARGRPRSRRALELIEGAVVVAVCSAGAAYGWLAPGPASFKLNALLVPANVLTFRAILVPSPPARTARLGALAVSPALGAAFFAWLGRDGGEAAQVEAALFAAWSLVSVALSTSVSLVVYGLRRSVRDALKLGQYQLEAKIGEGAMGAVYRARHALLRRPTAIKLLRSDAVGASALEHFEREVQLTSALTHPNTIAIYDYGRTADGVFYYAMELLDGLNLEDLVERWGPQPPSLVIHVLSQVCGALGEAHARGLVHRDIKAANIFLCDRGGIEDVVKVLDFGLVRHVSDGGDGSICGTPVYLAPEGVVAPERVDARTDLYAVGVLGYYLLTGTHPFEHAELLATLQAQVNDAPEAPSRRRPVPADLEAVILACLEKSPEARPQSADALSLRLDGCADADRWPDGSPRPWREPPTRGSPTDGRDADVPTLLRVDLRLRGPPPPDAPPQPPRDTVRDG